MPFEVKDPASGEWEGGSQYIPDRGCRIFSSCLACPLVECWEVIGQEASILQSLNAGVADDRLRAWALSNHQVDLGRLTPKGIEALGVAIRAGESDMAYAIRLSAAGIGRRLIEEWSGVGRNAKLKELTHA